MIGTDEERFAIWVFLRGRQGGSARAFLLEESTSSALERDGIAAAQAGTYVTACGRGYPCVTGERAEVTIANAGIRVISQEGPERIYYYDTRQRAFRSFWISD